MSTSLYPDQLLKRRVMAWAQRIRVNPDGIEIRELPTKWGTCSSDGVITFADDLPFADTELQDLVVVHELLHLRYKTHGKRFQAALATFIPNWREVEARGAKPAR